ncbi:MAG: hypothetical protein ACKOPS_21015, partial [Cyanobium sp.]
RPTWRSSSWWRPEPQRCSSQRSATLAALEQLPPEAPRIVLATGRQVCEGGVLRPLERLLVDAMQQYQRAGQILGVRLMVLDVAGAAGEAERTRLHSFYASMGFRPLPGRPERLFLSLSSLPPLQSGG